MTDSIKEIRLELDRITRGLSVVKEHNLLAVPFDLTATSGASVVLGKACQVLSIIDQKTLAGCIDISEWLACLPAWFVRFFRKELTIAESDAWHKKWRGFPPGGKENAEAEIGWSLEGWLYWLEPENRQWYLWSSGLPLENDSKIEVFIQTIDTPFASKSLVWLFKCSGASSFTMPLDA